MSEKGKNYRNSLIIFFFIGQFVSQLESSMSGFGLSVWLFEKMNVTQPFAVAFFCNNIAPVIMAPLAGYLADKYSKKYLRLICDTADAILKVFLIIVIIRIIFMKKEVPTFCGGFFLLFS